MATLEKLQSLLVRVQQRAAEPRPHRGSPPESGVSAAGVSSDGVDSEPELDPGIARALDSIPGQLEPAAARSLQQAASRASDAGELQELEELEELEEYDDELEEIADEQQLLPDAAPTAALAPPSFPDEPHPVRLAGGLQLAPERSFEALLDQALELGE